MHPTNPSGKPDDVSSAILRLKKQQNVLRSLARGLPPEAATKLGEVDNELGAVSGSLDADRLELAQLRALSRTWGMINSSLELGEVLTRVMEQVIGLTDAERGYILWKKPNTTELEFHVASSVERDPSDSSFQITKTVVNRVIETGEPLITDDASGDETLGEAASVMHYALRSVLCVPLKHKDGEVFGVVYVANRLKVGLFTKRELRLLTSVADQASIAIDNARVFTRVKTELQKANEELRRLRIEVDQVAVRQSVDDITETEYFRVLQEKAKKMRDQPHETNPADGDSNSS